ncbi:MAG: RNA polymerase sigma factor (sigma-70 family) [Verrucomicrobiales bacterium]|jgi:RNA polymerase sigma factor (sigma-70 family)
MSNGKTQSGTPAAAFPETPWTVLFQARGNNTLGSNALGELCQMYWYPVYAYVRRRGRSAHDAEDLTQEFFANFLRRGDFDLADRAKGRLRSFLATSVSHFLSQARRAENAQKRGGGETVLSIDAELAEQRYRNEPVDRLTPEKLFERRWALTILEHVLDQLKAEYIRQEKSTVFDALSGFLTGKGAETYATIGEPLGMSEDATKMAVHRLRKRFRNLLHRHITATVESAEEVDAEIQWMMAAFRE